MPEPEPDEAVPPELLLCPSLDALWAKHTAGPKAMKHKTSNKIDTKELILMINKEFSRRPTENNSGP